LVLDTSYSALFSPVDGSWEVVGGKISLLVLSVMTVVLSVSSVLSAFSVMSMMLALLMSLLVTEKSLELLRSPVSHVVDTPNSIIWVLFVVLGDLGKVVREDLESELILLLGSVGLAILSNVLIELSLGGLVNLEESS